MNSFSLFLLALTLANSTMAQVSNTTLGTNEVNGNLLGSLSASGLAASVSPSGSFQIDTNPALQFTDSKLAISVSLQYQGEVERFAGTNIWEQHLVPQAYGFRLNRDDFSFHLGYAQLYDFDVHSSFETTTENDPNGTGIFVGYRSQIDLHAYALGTSYRKQFEDEGTLHLGCQVELCRAHYRAYVVNQGTITYEESNKEDDLRWRAGATYSFQLDSGVHISMGGFYSSLLDIHGTVDYLRYVDYVLPASVDFGIQATLPSGFRVDLNAKRPMWQKTHPTMNERFEYSGSLVYSPTSTISTMLGFQTNYSRSNYDAIDDSIDAIFLVAGFGMQFQQTLVDFVIADSRLSDAEWQERTIVKLSLGYVLN